jgi:hypothetical protein
MEIVAIEPDDWNAQGPDKPEPVVRIQEIWVTQALCPAGF